MVNTNGIIGGSVVLAIIYSLIIVSLATFAVKKIGNIQKLIIKKGIILSIVKNSGVFVSLGGFYLFAFSYWGNPFQILGVVGGIIVFLIGISLGVIGSISEDFYKV